MGLWGAIKKAASTIGSAIKSAVKSFASVIAGNKPSKPDIDKDTETLKRQNPYDPSTATVDETAEIDRIVSNIRNKYYDKLYNIEKATIDYSRKTFDAMIEEIKNIVDKNKIDFNVKSVEYDFEKAEDEVQRLKKIMEMSTEQRDKIEKELDSLSKQLSLLRVEQYVTN